MQRVLIIDDHEVVRYGVRNLLATGFNNITITEGATASEAIALLVQSDWDLILLDINLPGRSGLEVLEESRRLRPKTPVLVLTSYPEDQFAIRSLKLGASGYLSKQAACDELVTAVKRVLAGGKYVTVSLAERLAGSLGMPAEHSPHESLSARELGVLRQTAQGMSTKEIAEALGLSEKTIATYRMRITAKTGLRTNVEITRYALKQGLVE